MAKTHPAFLPSQTLKGAVAFLASNASSFVTGQYIAVDNGAGRPSELHKKRFSRFDRRHLLKRHDLRGSLCHRRQGFKHVGTWPHAMEAGPKVIDVYWMTLSRAAWGSRSEAAGQ